MTILYAEDDSMTVMEVQEKLENNGYEVIVAGSPYRFHLSTFPE